MRILGRNQLACGIMTSLWGVLLTDGPCLSSRVKWYTRPLLKELDLDSGHANSTREHTTQELIMGWMENKRKTMIRFTCLHDVWLLREVLATNPFRMQTPKIGWDKIADTLKPLINKEICARRCRERTNLLLHYHRKCTPANVRQLGSEELNNEKEQLLRDIVQMQDEASGRRRHHRVERNEEKRLKEEEEEAEEEEDEEKEEEEGEEEDVVQHLLIEMQSQDEDEDKSNSESSTSTCQSWQNGERALLEYLQQKEANRSRLMEEDQKLKQRQLELEEKKLRLDEMKWNFEKSERLADRKMMMNMMTIIMQNCMQKSS